MIIVAILAVLFALFFFLKKHVGPAHLAVIAGISDYESFGKNIISLVKEATKTAPTELIEVIVFLVLVVGLPMLLYLRSGRGGLFGILRIVEAAIFSALLVSLCSWCITQFFPIDDLSNTILKYINTYKGIIMASGIGFAYFDILMYRDSN